MHRTGVGASWRSVCSARAACPVCVHFLSCLTPSVRCCCCAGVLVLFAAVTNIVSSENALVLEKIRAAGASSLNGAFSRKRSLRKKAKKLSRDR